MSSFEDSSANAAAVTKDAAETQEEGATTEINYICTTPECGKPARMACPTCLKLGIPPSRFCDQECFKSYWEEHKKLHKDVRKTRAVAKVDPSQMPTEFTGFQFTGTLRPYQKTPKRVVPDSIMKPDYAIHPLGIPLSEQEDKRTNNTIRVYSPADIAGIREACRIGREVLDIASSFVRVGITTDEIDRIVHEATIERGAYPSPLNYHRFPKSLCTSVNEVICHGIPDLRELQDGDIVNLDISVYKDGYHADLNETFFVGNVDEDSVRLVQCAYETLAVSVEMVRPGVLYRLVCIIIIILYDLLLSLFLFLLFIYYYYLLLLLFRDIGDAIAKVTKKAGCSIVTTYCGHGVGSLFHTAPNIPHYPKNKAKGTMMPGHIFTIEPMINLGKYKDVLWPDDWTAVTADGTRSAQFEHTMLVTETGVELLTARPGEPLDRMIWDREKFQR
jgi:methionyl aminopeptidase